jgi:uncharacterized protein YmfQ (DUF2313 family)
MARTSSNYIQLLQSLLPRGKVWTRNTLSILGQVLDAIAQEFVRFEQTVEELLIERDTRKTTELILNHEYDLGLPDECSQIGATLAKRRLTANAKLVALGGGNKQYFIDLASALDFIITIQEYPDAGLPNIFNWQVTVDYDENIYLEYFTAGSSVAGDPLSSLIGIDELICFITRYKPAHTVVNFVLNGPNFDQAFSVAFKALVQEDGTTGSFDHAFSIGFDVCYGGGFDFNSFDASFNKPG